MDEVTVDATKPVEQKSYTIQDFAYEYNMLCNKMGYRVSSKPDWKPTNHGTFELVVVQFVEKIEK